MSDARHHHYIPQCYLRGFTATGDKDSKLLVLDSHRNKCFETIPRNVAGRRDFNRVEIEGLEPNSVEMSLSTFESELATAIKNIQRTGTLDGDDKIYILNLIALLNVRSPQQRENVRQFHEQIADRVMDLAVSSREMWESQVQQMKEAGQDVNEDVTYEDAKDFQVRGEYTVDLNREYQISREFESHDIVLRTLMNRNWMMIMSDNDDSGEFITSDNPTMLTWQNPDEVPPLYRQTPGHGLRGTDLYFPLTKNLALSGVYDGRVGVFAVTRELVAACNSITASYVYEQLYAANSTFPVRDPDGVIVSGQILVDYLESEK